MLSICVFVYVRVFIFLSLLWCVLVTFIFTNIKKKKKKKKLKSLKTSFFVIFDDRFYSYTVEIRYLIYTDLFYEWHLKSHIIPLCEHLIMMSLNISKVFSEQQNLYPTASVVRN